MPSDKHNSRTSRARDLISLLINVTSSQDPICAFSPTVAATVLASWCYLCTPILSSQLHKVTIYSRHVIARHKDCRGTSYTIPCLLCYEMRLTLLKLRCYGRLLRIEIWGVCFTSVFSVFSVMAGWIAEMLFMVFFAYIAMKRTEHR